MPGFIGVIGNKNYEFENIFTSNDVFMNRETSLENISLAQITIKKFLNDKVFKENKDVFILTEGVILNSLELIKKYKSSTFFEAINKMYVYNGIDFFKEFRGSFSGVFYDKKEDILVIFTDQIGDKQIFFSKSKKSLVFGSEINYITNYYQKSQESYSLNVEAAYHLLTFGYLLENETLFDRIYKLNAGHYMVYKKGKMNIVQYHRFDNTPDYNQKEEEIVNNIDKLFRQAVKRAFDKDNEYGYKHLVALSGGLDSRLTTWVANDMGYGENIVNFTFSQSDYLDEVIPKKIASDLRHEWIFKSLDNGVFLKRLDEIVKITSGGAIYYGQAHGKSCLDLINKVDFGIVHTGQLGDVIIGTYNSSPEYQQYYINDGLYSKKLIKKVNIDDIIPNYANDEIFKLYQRGFNGMNQGLLVYQERLETYSPFYDLDFFEYCLSIPIELRFKHNIYFKWIMGKYPGAADYKWEKINSKITDKQMNIFGRQVALKQIPKKTLAHLIKKFTYNDPTSTLGTKNHMNPLDYWYKTNKDLREFMDNYYSENIHRISGYADLKKDCEYLYNNGSNIEKNQVLTLLSVMKQYF